MFHVERFGLVAVSVIGAVPLTSTSASDEILAIWNRIPYVEAAGVFWILAEAAILLAVLHARKDLTKSMAYMNISRPLAKRIGVWILLLGLILCCFRILGLFMTLPTYVHTDMSTGHAQLQGAYWFGLHHHYALWALFVTMWVALEILITYHGSLLAESGFSALGRPPVRDFAALRRILLLVLGISILSGATVTACFLLRSASMGSSGLLLRDYGYRNPIGLAIESQQALHLYLRMAGIVWIAVEWIAAAILWKTFRALSDTTTGQLKND